MLRFVTLNVGLLILATPAIAVTTPMPPGKIVVRTQDQLPRFSYAVPTSATDLLLSDTATFNGWAARIAHDIEATLERYDIQDHTSLRKLLEQRLAYEILTNQNSAALRTSAKMRSLEDKSDKKLLSGLFEDALLNARIKTGRDHGSEYEQAFASNYAAALSSLPWSIVGNGLKEEKSADQILTREFVLGIVKADIEPAVAKSHSVDSSLADELLFLRTQLQVTQPLRSAALAALTREVAANNVQKADIWAARDVVLSSPDKLTPVAVAVWDSGSDLSLFPNQTYTDPRLGNANAPTAHGLAFDLQARPTTGVLYPLTADQASQYPAMLDDLTGFSDLGASIDSAAADALKLKLSKLPASEVPAYLERLKLYEIYVHGTHVAGIIARGNPAVRLAVARRTFDYRNMPERPTDELVHRRATSFQAAVDWFRAHGVRVVNMSWGISPQDYETDLQRNGIGKDSVERKALATHYFQIDRQGLLDAIKSAPETLFVCAAGNSDSDTGFDETAPSSFVLPNLMVVGAVDRAGDEASFTSYGKNVDVDANGYDVKSFVPGGRTLMLSGTSMASPEVVNLAAKLLALHPELTPVKLRELIIRGATASADGRRHNIDESASVALLKRN
jgi:subtilisin family serine protease